MISISAYIIELKLYNKIKAYVCEEVIVKIQLTNRGTLTCPTNIFIASVSGSLLPGRDSSVQLPELGEEPGPSPMRDVCDWLIPSGVVSICVIS